MGASSIGLFMVGAGIRWGVAIILAASAVHAMRDWARYEAILRNYELLPSRMAWVAAKILPPLGLLAAFELILPATGMAGAKLALCLMALFTAAIAINLKRGRDHIDCGCGGASGQRLSAGLLYRNGALIGLLLLTMLLPVRGVVSPSVSVGVGGAVAAFIALYFTINQLLTNIQAFRTPELAPELARNSLARNQRDRR